MPEAERTFVVDPAPGLVLDYLKDFEHAEEWDPGTESCERSGAPGPVHIGTTWHNTSRIAGSSTELTYTLIDLKDDRIVFEGENGTVRTTDVITLEPHGDGTRITYRATLELKGGAKVAAPIASLGLRKLGKDTEEQLTEVLNRLA